ncbi:MAG TPA: hypothetical protein VKG45_02430 [Actinomycetes bacterium]|nr:hypothetical protein [Actinomycetes bacterium]
MALILLATLGPRALADDTDVPGPIETLADPPADQPPVDGDGDGTLAGAARSGATLEAQVQNGQDGGPEGSGPEEAGADLPGQATANLLPAAGQGCGAAGGCPDGLVNPDGLVVAAAPVGGRPPGGEPPGGQAPPRPPQQPPDPRLTAEDLAARAKELEALHRGWATWEARHAENAELHRLQVRRELQALDQVLHRLAAQGDLPEDLEERYRTWEERHAEAWEHHLGQMKAEQQVFDERWARRAVARERERSQEGGSTMSIVAGIEPLLAPSGDGGRPEIPGLPPTVWNGPDLILVLPPYVKVRSDPVTATPGTGQTRLDTVIPPSRSTPAPEETTRTSPRMEAALEAGRTATRIGVVATLGLVLYVLLMGVKSVACPICSLAILPPDGLAGPTPG